MDELTQAKTAQYKAVAAEINALLEGETQAVLKMATIVAVLKSHFAPRFFWCGFYVMHNGELIISAYQGSVACQHIALNRGVCGRAARTGQAQIVADTHADPEHIACDSRSNSEIVLPVFDHNGQLVAVLDIDSTDYNAFDRCDQLHLEEILQSQFAAAPLVLHYNISIS
jgi:GAF domain-containing protein